MKYIVMGKEVATRESGLSRTLLNISQFTYL